MDLSSYFYEDLKDYLKDYLFERGKKYEEISIDHYYQYQLLLLNLFCQEESLSNVSLHRRMK